MNELDFFIGRRFEQAVRHEHSWAFHFDGDTGITVECLWRLIEDRRIRRTSQDDGHKFGLPAPVDVIVEVNQKLTGAVVSGVTLQAGTLDLELQFSTGHALQFLPDSSGYESWAAHQPSWEYIACGGGQLAIFGPTDEGGT